MWGSITQSKMKELVYLYETFQNAGENEKRKPSDIEELKQFSRGLDRNFSPFTAYNPLTKRTIDALYLPPKNEEDDELTQESRIQFVCTAKNEEVFEVDYLEDLDLKKIKEEINKD